jgi:hypothetical protein
LIEYLRKQPDGASFEYIYIVTPMLNDMAGYNTYPKCVWSGGKPVKVINVAQPALYPNLYRAELWRDPAHLNARGAVEFTRLVAKSISAEIAAGNRKQTDCASI